jgi:succinoglycan biosynthesis transport protein ExoP
MTLDTSGAADDDEGRGVSPVDLQNYFGILRRRWISATIVALATIALAAAVTLATATKYTATTRLYFAVEASQNPAEGTSLAEKQLASYPEVVTSPLVLEPVIDQLNLQTSAAKLARAVRAVVRPDTVIVEISAVDAEPKRAAAIANAIGAEVQEVSGTLTPEREGGSSVQVTTLAPALVPTEPSSPNVARNLAVGLLLGLLFGAGTAAFRHLQQSKIRDEADVRAVTAAPLLSVIGLDDKVRAHPIIVHDQPLSSAAESVRRLRANLEFTGVADARSIVITSAVSGEGKSMTALNLAVSLAYAGSRVILVDADLRQPSVARALGMEGHAGLTSVLIGRAQLRDVVQHWQNSTLDVLPAGRIPPNPGELLGSTPMKQLLSELTARYDVVLLDSPPLLAVPDAASLSGLVGGSVLVIGADLLHRRQLQQAIESLNAAGGHVDGVVVNKVARQEAPGHVDAASHQPLPAAGVIAPAAPKRAQPEPENYRPASGRAAGSTQKDRQGSRKATPVPH